ncbi:MAG: hypothetical protein G01um101470_224 [Parcubacteria group bacterium Gr01-1014_70]|nr:MAG: hypothetical protein G01um101470_224 [Parcubacteria group bacterium Gr01-1014_70]
MSNQESLERVRQDNRVERQRLIELREKQPIKNKGNVGLAEKQVLELIDKTYAEFVMNSEFRMRRLVDFTILARQEVLEGDNIENTDDEELLALLFEFCENNEELLDRMEKRVQQKKEEDPEFFS